MADYIDREKLLEDLERFAPECRAAFLIIEKQEAVKAVPVVHGRWFLNEGGSATCTNCRRHTKNCWDEDSYYRHCPDCGALMGLEVKDA